MCVVHYIYFGNHNNYEIKMFNSVCNYVEGVTILFKELTVELTSKLLLNEALESKLEKSEHVIISWSIWMVYILLQTCPLVHISR
jgi:hypothetical protein